MYPFYQLKKINTEAEQNMSVSLCIVLMFIYRLGTVFFFVVVLLILMVMYKVLRNFHPNTQQKIASSVIF